MSSEAQRLRELSAVNRAIVSTLDYDEVLRLVVDKTAEFTDADVCALILTDEENRARVSASHGIDGNEARNFVAPLDERINVALRKMLGYREQDTFLGVPIIYRGRIDGLLVVYRRGPSAPRPDEEFLVSALADQVAIALEHARRYGEVAQISARQARLLTTIQSNTTTCLAYLDKDLRFVQANAAYYAASGRSPEELIGRTLEEIVPSSDTAQTLREVRSSLVPVERTEMRMTELTADPTQITFWDWSARPIRGPRGDFEGLVISAVDVSDKVRARGELEAASRHKDEFLAMLAHELRNPLSAIASAMAIFEWRFPDDPVLCRARDAASRQIGHMKRLLDDLFDVSRITRGKITLQKATLELPSVVEQAIEASMPSISAKRHQLTVQLESVLVEGDADRLVQVVSNLLTNAAKYTQPGGHIALTVRHDEDTVELRVKDDGLGIAPDLLPHVFDLFVQSPRGLDRTQGGLGIGLTVVKRLVEMHGGRVEAHSEGLDRGSEFVVRLPLLSARAHAADEGPSDRAPAPSAKRILLVEDNLDAAESLGALLELDGHEVTIAGDGASALELAREVKPDVVLLDVGLPGIDGFEVARRLRREHNVPEPRILGLSGYGREDDRERATRAGMDAYVVKPIDRETLRELIEA